ncbi:MED15 polymerase, partial [Odontophorus gujanensis]|nr:MED15 polymerase [Odontophorus gujanensis]
ERWRRGARCSGNCEGRQRAGSAAAGMDVTGPETDWRSTNFRQKLVSQIDEAMRKAGVAHNKSSKDMESHVFMKAKTREEYLSLVARLIIHFRDIHNKKSQASVSDPMNALQNLTGGPPAGAPGMAIASRAQGAPMTGMGGLGPMGQQMSLPGQQQPPGNSGMAPHGMPGVSTATQQSKYSLLMQQQMQQMQQQQQQQQQVAQAQQSQLPPQSQPQPQPMVSQAQAISGQIPGQVMPVTLTPQQLKAMQKYHTLIRYMFTLFCLFIFKVRAQLVQQQHAAAAAVQAAQAQAAQMGASAQMITAPMARGGMQIRPRFPPTTAVSATPPSSIPMGGQQMPQVFTESKHIVSGMAQSVQYLNEFSGSKPPEGSSLPPFTEMIIINFTVTEFGAVLKIPYLSFCPLGIPHLPPEVRKLLHFFPPSHSVCTVSLSTLICKAVSQNSITMMSSPSPVQQAQTPQSMPPPPQPQPSPQPGQPSSQPNSNVSSGPAPSPSSFLPSPSPQPSQSPAAARTPQNFSVPSPGPLNTPGNPNSVMSPASSSQSEEQQYLEKLKQLSKYIEPLRRMINKIDKNEDRKKDLSKMKSLLDILTDPSKRCPLKTLQKCEIALEKLKNDMAVPTPPPPPVPPTKQQYLCQPLLDAVLANIRSPVFNHSLYRTFMPAMTAIHGPPITAPVISSRKRKYEEDDRQTIPNVLQGEVARLNPKFLVNLDPSHCSNNGTVHLICKLDDKNLPNVPPLQLSVPADYPDQSPLWIKNPRQYAANPFLQSVYQYMTSKLLQLPDKHSVTALLNTWAQSIRQACLSAA